jgi:hypothetical protein
MRRLAFVPLALTIACGGSPTASTQTAAAPNLAGSWTLQTHASASCAAQIPADVRNRSYGTVTITQAGGTINVTVLTGVGTLPVMIVPISGPALSGQFQLVDNTGSGLQIIGLLTATASANSITGTLNGAFISGSGPSCSAADHTMTFARR